MLCSLQQNLICSTGPFEQANDRGMQIPVVSIIQHNVHGLASTWAFPGQPGPSSLRQLFGECNMSPQAVNSLKKTCNLLNLQVLGLTLLFSKLFYNAYIHPLRKFPGPLLARLSRLYYSYYRSTGQLEWKTLELHKKYGSVVRIAPNECKSIPNISGQLSIAESN